MKKFRSIRIYFSSSNRFRNIRKIYPNCLFLYDFSPIHQASIGLPKNLYACLFTTSSLVVLCTISIFCLVAVSIDRYWVWSHKLRFKLFLTLCFQLSLVFYLQAILHPLAYSRNVRTKTAIGQFAIRLFCFNFTSSKGCFKICAV